VGPVRIHPEVLRELADVITKLLFIIFEGSWRTGEVLLQSSKRARRMIQGTTGHSASPPSQEI